MSLERLLSRVRDHYVEQLLMFVRQQASTGKQSAAEVKLRLSEQSRLFQSLYCVDYIENADEGVSPLEMLPDRLLRFNPAAFQHRRMVVRVESICWDDVEITFDGAVPDLDAWFDAWFDPEEKNFESTAELSGRIHSFEYR
ncbi:MAG: hypothetical protein ACT4OF_05570 [Caulobacteraceae bacterium]